MKLVSFFFLSLFVHAAALAFPVAFNPPSSPEAFRVVLLEIGSTGAGMGNSANPRSQPGPSTSTVHKPSNFLRAVGSTGVRGSRAPGLAEEAITQPEKAAKDTENHVALFSQRSEPEIDPMNFSDGGSDGAGHDNAMGYGEQTGQYGGTELGPGTGIGSSSAHGVGIGQGGGSATTARITQASFRHAPPPEYPEAARRDGKEGQVLLRVLVDEQGRSKAVEISHSSGSDLLDRAATEAVKQWRFSPARNGDTPMPSWVRIPVNFRLTAAR
jgi:TonB family protein